MNGSGGSLPSTRRTMKHPAHSPRAMRRVAQPPLLTSKCGSATLPELHGRWPASAGFGTLTSPRRRLSTRWPVLQLYVRCALAAHEPQRIRQYLACGRKLVLLGVLGEAQARQQMTRTLLLTALDEGLPAFWRSACLECARTLGVSPEP